MPKLLLVEDDINLRDIYSARFMAEQYTVITAADGEEALASAVRERPDLIILDVMMPKISGFDVLDILRSTPETKETKIIMMTALSQETDKARGEALGVNKYLIKSQVTLEDVVGAVKEILAGPSQTTEPQEIAPMPTAAPETPAAVGSIGAVEPATMPEQDEPESAAPEPVPVAADVAVVEAESLPQTIPEVTPTDEAVSSDVPTAQIISGPTEAVPVPTPETTSTTPEQPVI